MFRSSLFFAACLAQEKHEFQAEVSRLMDIIINSLYTDKSVFLRELVSNAADAVEKARILSVSDPDYLNANKDLEIKLEFDEDAKTFSIIDSGIGMSKSDLINNLGTVAKSGTTNFLESMKESADSNLIGQFGVGFYSAFLVADKVQVFSRSNDEAKEHVWESTADASFTINEVEDGELARGTKVKLHLKEDAHQFLSADKVKELIKKYSQFVQFPLYLKAKKEVENEEDDEDLTDDSEEEEETEQPAKETVWEWEQLNPSKPLWVRAKEDISEEEYLDFYKAVTNDWQKPMAYTHFTAEGEVDFRSILYVPSTSNIDSYYTTKSELKLFVRRVLVSDSVDAIFPKYLNFMKGVVDSDDLPLNVSREQLQQNKVMKVISKKLVRKALMLFRSLATKERKEKQKEAKAKDEQKEDQDEKDEEEKEETDEKDEKEKDVANYTKFYAQYSDWLKLGCHEDDANRSKIARLLKFWSSTENKEVFLEDYLERMKEEQKNIYYISGETKEAMHKMSHMQMFKKKDIEVLMLTANVDEHCLTKLTDFEGKKFVSVQKADPALLETEEDKKQFEGLTKVYQPLTDSMRDYLKKQSQEGDLKDSLKVDKVVLSKRLVDSPAVLVATSHGLSATQERMMKSNAMNKYTMPNAKVLELNPYHPLIAAMLEQVETDQEKLHDLTKILVQTTLIEAGYSLPDPSFFVKRLHSFMNSEVGLSADAALVEVEIPETTTEAPEAVDTEEEEVIDTDKADAKEEL